MPAPITAIRAIAPCPIRAKPVSAQFAAPAHPLPMQPGARAEQTWNARSRAGAGHALAAAAAVRRAAAVVGLTIYVMVGRELWQIAEETRIDDDMDLVIALCSVLDLVLIANLLVMVAVSSVRKLYLAHRGRVANPSRNGSASSTAATSR